MKIGTMMKNIVCSEGSTPLPIGICLLMFIIVLFNDLTMTSVFSYLPRLVKEFGISEVDVGKKTGIISSSMFIAKIFSSSIWGYFCDKWGRKLSLLMSAGGVVLSTLMFGFSFNYNWAVMARFFQGCFMGITVGSKAYMTDICDDSNMAMGLGLIFGALNIGLVLGPSMADSFFDRFKIFIPNFIIAFGLTLALLASIFYLPKRTSSDKVPLSVEDKNNTINKDLLNHEKSEPFSKFQTETSRLIISKPSMFKKHWMLLRTSSFVTLLRNKYFLLSATLYGMYTFCLSGFDELFSLFASTSIEYGGLGMSTSEIGILYLIISIGTLVVQFIIVSRVIIKFGSKKIFIGASLLSGVLIPFIPLYSNIKNKAALWTIMWIHQMFIRAGLITGYTTVNIFINNSVGSDLLGVANGVGLSLACIGRSIGTASFGSMYSWSLKNKEKSFPLNKHFSFLMILIVITAVSLFSICIPESLNKKKIESKQQQNVIL
ncbi:uncharacterized protein LOC105846723 isoform X2 [Hydra vulgaris]|uniref:uncharacterized protein LOC105846723 isoform X2 n=1 Tax=Hydra vulgaris TaxID=6087 RepID=UPI0032EA5063